MVGRVGKWRVARPSFSRARAPTRGAPTPSTAPHARPSTLTLAPSPCRERGSGALPRCGQPRMSTDASDDILGRLLTSGDGVCSDILGLLSRGVFKATACFPPPRNQQSHAFINSAPAGGVSSCCIVLPWGRDQYHAPEPLGPSGMLTRNALTLQSARARTRLDLEMPSIAASRSTSAAGRGPLARTRMRSDWAALVFAPSLGRDSASARRWAGNTGLRQATAKSSDGLPWVPAFAGVTEEGGLTGLRGSLSSQTKCNTRLRCCHGETLYAAWD